MWSIGDSNPMRGSYANAAQAFIVFFCITVGALLLGLMFVTGHGKAATLIIVALCFISLIVRALLARERDH